MSRFSRTLIGIAPPAQQPHAPHFDVFPLRSGRCAVIAISPQGRVVGLLEAMPAEAYRIAHRCNGRKEEDNETIRVQCVYARNV